MKTAMKNKASNGQLHFVKATEADRKLLWNIFQKFLYEMTNYYDDVMDAEGNYHYGYFDRYFEEPDRTALLLYEGNALVGFAMLNSYSYIGAQPDHVLAEFTIFPMYRRRHLGRQAAEWLFRTYPGAWELKYNERNAGAKALWTAATAPFCPAAHRYSADETVLAFQTTTQG
jgi:predicted acetyltransferase